MSTPAVGLLLSEGIAPAVGKIFSGAGYQVLVECSHGFTLQRLAEAEVDAWVFDARRESLYDILKHAGQIILPADNSPSSPQANDFQAWSKGLLRQLDSALGSRRTVLSAEQDHVWEGIRGVWVLAGSAGATGAVQEFLNGFEQPPPVAFIYAQHYSLDEQEQLQQLTLENNLFTLETGQDQHQLAAGKVVMLSPNSSISITRSGQVSLTRSPWGSGLTPNISEVLNILATAATLSSGAIIFSGMGDDGAAALPGLHASGARIWVQSPASAVCDSMPRAALATGLVHRSGSPAQLAEALAHLYLV